MARKMYRDWSPGPGMARDSRQGLVDSSDSHELVAASTVRRNVDMDWSPDQE